MASDRQQSLPPRQVSGERVDPLPPALNPPRLALEGRYARVEPLDPDRHIEELFATAGSGKGAERIWDYMGYGPFPTRQAMHAWLRDGSAAFDPVYYAIRDGRTERASGMASYLNIHAKNSSIEIGNIWFGLALQNSPAATETLYLMARHAFDDLGYRRLEWKCDALNQPSRRAAARLGFAFEGIFYQHMIVKGRNRDTAWFSILDGEWPAIRANFETWLAPENFDPDGRQIRSLRELNRPLRPEAQG